MLVEMMFITIALSFLFLVPYTICKISDVIYNKKEAKRKSEHPILFYLFQEYNSVGEEEAQWILQQIQPKKKEIDTILKDMPYYPAEIFIKKEKELERLRSDVYVAQLTARSFVEQKKEIKEKINDYIDKHNIKWMEKWD